MTPIYDRVALIGLGLIASSMFWAMKRAGLAGEVTGYARSQKPAIRRARSVCVTVFATPSRGGREALIWWCLCVPVGVMGAVAAEIAPTLKAGCDCERRGIGQA